MGPLPLTSGANQLGGPKPLSPRAIVGLHNLGDVGCRKRQPSERSGCGCISEAGSTDSSAPTSLAGGTTDQAIGNSLRTKRLLHSPPASPSATATQRRCSVPCCPGLGQLTCVGSAALQARTLPPRQAPRRGRKAQPPGPASAAAAVMGYRVAAAPAQVRPRSAWDSSAGLGLCFNASSPEARPSSTSFIKD